MHKIKDLKQKATLLDSYHFPYKGDFVEFLGCYYKDIQTYNAKTDKVGSSYLNDNLIEYADNDVPPYNWDRLQWLAKTLHNAEELNECVAEFGINEKDFDIYKLIGMAIFRQTENGLMNVLNEIIK